MELSVVAVDFCCSFSRVERHPQAVTRLALFVRRQILGTPLPLHILRYRTPSMFIMLLNPGHPIPINPSIKPFPWLDPAQQRRDRNTRKEFLLPLRERGTTGPRFSE